MSPDEAVRFLEAHQPMPPDSELTQELITEFDDARRALEHSRERRVAELLLNSFGEGDGLGVYQLLDETLMTLPRENVVGALQDSLRSPFASVRSWSMEMALDYRERALIPQAVGLLASMDRDQRVFAAYFLEEFESHDARTVRAMQEALRRDPDEEIASVLRHWLAKR